MSKEETRTIAEDEDPTTEPDAVPAAGDPSPDAVVGNGAAGTDDAVDEAAVDTDVSEGIAPDEVEPAEIPGEDEEIATGRWTVGLSLGMVAGAAGLFANSPALFLSGVVGLVYAVYGYATRPPSMTVLVDREITDDSPLPGDEVQVTITAENVGSRSIPDLRVIDDVPPDMPVVEGSPTLATTLQPGETAEITYTVEARRGVHTFGETTLVGRNLSGATERRRRLPNEVTVTCRSMLSELPLESMTIPYTGRVETDSGGEGLEFWATRQYTHGDPMRRIDWNRYARTNELTTKVYRETEAATVVVVVDDRNESKVVRSASEPNSLELCRHAGRLIAETLLSANNRVGVAMYGDGAYLTQGGGKAQRVRIERLLTEGPGALSEDSKRVRMAYGGERVSTLRRHFPESAQVIFVTPLLDDDPVDLASAMEAHGHAVTVVTPDMTTADTAGGTLSRVDRTERLRRLRENRTRVVDWSPDDPLEAAVQRAIERWSR